MAEININLLSKEQLENNLIIMTVNKDDGISQEKMQQYHDSLWTTIECMNLDFTPAILITDKTVDIKGSKELKEIIEKNKKFTRFEIMDI